MENSERILRLDAYVIDTLLPDLVGHDRRPGAFLVYLYLWRRTAGGTQEREAISLREIAEGSGLSRRSVQSGLAVLARRHLVLAHRESTTAVTQYSLERPWARRC